MLKRYETIGDLQGVENVTLSQLFNFAENNSKFTELELKAIIKVATIAKKYNLI